MPVIQRIYSKFYEHLVELRLWVLFSLICAYLLISWLLFFWAGETDLVTDPVVFLYFASTTASTVGYGDLSPATEAGRLISAIWFVPGALLIFTAVLSKLTSSLVQGVRRMVDGRGNFKSLTGATVIIGYHSDRTERMITDLIAGRDNDTKIVLLATSADITVPEGVRYVRGDRLDTLETLKRAAVEYAEKIIVYTESDAETFNTCLAIRELSSDVHVAAYFGDRDTARRATKLAHVEAVVSSATETLVRAAQDPGASRVIMALSSATHNATIYSGILEGAHGYLTTDVEQQLLSVDAVLLAVGQNRADDVSFKPFPHDLGGGTTVYYVAQQRLEPETWSRLMEKLDAEVLA
ncbi:potassium channel related protein [Pseudovibrio sp. FO-BEG1]|uniref:ion channel n=1 Tax=Pseudovibrio sp. (strain FO-BEG1) TaxID=911045 RepID=UPI000238D220|nr:ion channel [Pseudovibrio sp. FO-BEG1]AEV38698.1 potassium channel related protein [Pseudovibrio sp. FO-BEG1]